MTDVVFGFPSFEESQRQTCMGSQSSFCGCVALSTALASYINFFALTSMSFRDLPLVEYDRRSLKKLFSAEADFLLLFY